MTKDHPLTEIFHYSQILETSLYKKLVRLKGEGFFEHSNPCDKPFNARKPEHALSQAQSSHAKPFGFANMLTALQELSQEPGAWTDSTEGLTQG